ncbi:MAG: HAMP domain-containing histidine kinase [Proteobacteria bacterium]|nr:MAG: HAMP domain-containing histidine kinase [Pseudomonadota bacterium]
MQEAATTSKPYTGSGTSGKTAKKLLTKTTNNFLIFSVLVLLVSAPLFYLFTENLYVDEADETLKLHKEEFVTQELPSFKISEIAQWNRFNRNIQIKPAKNISKAVIFDTIYFDKLENENEPYRELNAPITIEGRPFIFSGRINMIETRDMVQSIAALFSIVIFLLMSGMLLIGKIYSRKTWKPFYDTLLQIQGFEINKSKKPKLAVTGVTEFNQLNSSLNRLIDKNTVIYNNQKEFVENAAHELQTPLALFQAKIDLLFQMDIPEEQSLILTSLNADVARLNRLNKNLLLLSKIGNSTGHYFDRTPILFDEYVKKHLEFFTEQAAAKAISIEVDLAEGVKVDCNPELAEVLINNLFLNAIRHNVKGGEIQIRLDRRSLTFRNTGPENALEHERIFNRFEKSDPESQGSGLGLAIVKKIADANQWEVSYSFADGMHNFRVEFV